MTAVSPEPRVAGAARRGVPWRPGALGVAVALGLVAHGCHGADVDHEPGVAAPAERR